MPEKIRATYYRGGTSRAVIFRRQDLPVLPASGNTLAWDAIFTGIMGSPDGYGRQLDGMGGGISSLSKVAIVTPSERADADVDYTFGQVGIDRANVSYRGNCGNISSAIGPFAVEEGMVQAQDGFAQVRIFNTNTRKHLVARFEVRDGQPRIDGAFEIDGVAGGAAPIELSFMDPTGSVTGQMFPTGSVRDILKMESGAEVEATLIDVANPIVIVAASVLSGDADGFASKVFEAPSAVAFAEEVRIAAAIAMGIVPDAEQARTNVTNLPLVSFVRKPGAYLDRSGRSIGAERVDILTQMYSAGLPHKATPVTGAMALAAAVQVPGTIANEAVRANLGAGEVRVGHPSGVLNVGAQVSQDGGIWQASQTSVLRTARRLFEGQVILPPR